MAALFLFTVGVACMALGGQGIHSRQIGWTKIFRDNQGRSVGVYLRGPAARQVGFGLLALGLLMCLIAAMGG